MVLRIWYTRRISAKRIDARRIVVLILWLVVAVLAMKTLWMYNDAYEWEVEPWFDTTAVAVAVLVIFRMLTGWTRTRVVVPVRAYPVLLRGLGIMCILLASDATEPGGPKWLAAGTLLVVAALIMARSERCRRVA
jgi:peptidoglycan/LPS O-acetylase OafA/YrhL